METNHWCRFQPQHRPFNFLASLINGNFLGQQAWDMLLYAFNFLASLINGNNISPSSGDKLFSSIF